VPRSKESIEKANLTKKLTGNRGGQVGYKHIGDNYKKLFWQRPKVECEVCGRLIGVNNIKVHKRKQHGH
jgi:transposase